MKTKRPINFDKYDLPVKEYMENLVDCLQSDYKAIPASWLVSLELIADNYEIYLRARDDVKKGGTRIQNSRGTYVINPSFSVMNTAQNHITKLVSSFGLTPISKSKMKALDNSQNIYDDLIE